jgi:hypothetical protein
MIGIYMGQSTKAFVSLSMPRKMIIKLWKELVIMVTLMVTIIVMTIILISRRIDIDIIRLFNMDLDHMGVKELLVMFVIIMVIFHTILQLVSIISNIGNNYGIINLITAIAIGIAIIVTMIIPLLNLIIWGDNLYLYIAVLTVVNFLMMHVNKKMLKRVEVLR